jgi:hypothetical protein
MLSSIKPRIKFFPQRLVWISATRKSENASIDYRYSAYTSVADP